jgi:hypothetical protein
MKYTLLRAVRHKDKSYRCGDEIELDEVMAKRFADRKWIQLDGKVPSKNETNKRRRDRLKAVKKSDPPSEATSPNVDESTSLSDENTAQESATHLPAVPEPAVKPGRKRPAINADAV